MKYFKALFFLCLLAVGCASSKYNSTVLPMVGHSLTIEGFQDEWRPIGAAVAVNKGGNKYILSARHVIDMGYYIPLRACSVLIPDSCIEITPSTVSSILSSSDPRRDWIALPLDKYPRGVRGAVAGPKPQVGDRIWIVGSPLGIRGELSHGIVTNSDDQGSYSMDARALPGNSGGPVFNQNQQLIGIVIAILNTAVGVQENYGIFIPTPDELL